MAESGTGQPMPISPKLVVRPLEQQDQAPSAPMLTEAATSRTFALTSEFAHRYLAGAAEQHRISGTSMRAQVFWPTSGGR